MSRRIPLPICLFAITLMATGIFLRADDPPAAPPPGTPTPPPGYKVVYQNMGGKKVPVFVKDQLDPLRHAGNIGLDPLDPQKVFSETNAESNKTFNPADVDLNKSSGLSSKGSFTTKVYDTTSPGSVYNVGSKSTYHTSSFDGGKTSADANQLFATKSVSPDLDKSDSAFAPIGSPDQDSTAPGEAKTYATFASPEQGKDYTGPEADIIHNRKKPGTPIDGDMQVIGEIPNRPLSIDEVKNLINHGFKADLTEPPAPASKPLNDPNYQPEPLRIEPDSSSDDAPTTAPRAQKVQDDDANDPVPSPGTMAEHPEDAQTLPSK